MKIQHGRLNPKIKRVIENIVYPVLAFGLVFALWAAAAAAKDNAVLLPMPDEVIVKTALLFGESEFWLSLGWTLARTLICFAVSFALAFALASLGGLFKPLHRIMSPIVAILRAVPTMAFILIIMIWIDFQQAPVYIGFLIAFPIFYSSFYSAITGVDKDLTEMTKVYKIRAIDKVRFLYAPEIASSVFDVSASTVSLTLKVIIASEVLCYTRDSIGFGMKMANLTFEISNLLAWTVAAVLLSFALEMTIGGAKRAWEAARRGRDAGGGNG
jgi:NitT/TauT family transport system permease protein